MIKIKSHAIDNDLSEWKLLPFSIDISYQTYNSLNYYSVQLKGIEGWIFNETVSYSS